MSGPVHVQAEADAIVVRVPLKLCKRGSQGRKLMVAADGEKHAWPVARQEQATVLKALGRGYRWKRMLESGEYSSISELAKADKINHAYVRRILRLTLLSPDIVEALLSGRRLTELRLEGILQQIPIEWSEQWRELLACHKLPQHI